MNQDKVNLLELTFYQMGQFFDSLGEKNFRVLQVMKWIHQFGVDNFDDMTNLSKKFRETLKEKAEIRGPDVISEHVASDGTCKWALRLAGGQAVEAVFIPEENRGTLCVSSQVGCVLDCQFCSTGKQGFSRNLTMGEMIGQLWYATRKLGTMHTTGTKTVTNVVMMGMGEPLLNFYNVVGAMNLMMDDNAYGLSKRRVTLSTSGVVPALDELIEHTDVALAISLHAANDKLRDELVPINRKYPIKVLLESVRRYIAKSSAVKKVTIEYVMLSGVNDSEQDANELALLLKDIPCKVNLIPFNPFPGTDYVCSSGNRLHAFERHLMSKGLIVTIRKTRGEDIDAACGQLVGRVNDKTNRLERRLRKQEKLVNIQTDLS